MIRNLENGLVKVKIEVICHDFPLSRRRRFSKTLTQDVVVQDLSSDIFRKSEMGHFGKLLSMCGGEDRSQRSGICGQFPQLKITKIPESVLPRILGGPRTV